MFTYRPVCTYRVDVYVQANVYIQAGVYVQANVYVQARCLSACFGAMSVISTILVLQTFRIYFFLIFFHEERR